MNCWWVQHLQTICVFPFPAVSIPPPSTAIQFLHPYQSYSLSSIAFLSRSTLTRHTHAYTLSACPNMYTDTDMQISSCLVQMAVTLSTSRGKQSAIISPGAAAVMVAPVCCCHACNKRTIQSPLSSSAHWAMVWEIVDNLRQNELQPTCSASMF